MVLTSLPWKYRHNEIRLPRPCPQVATRLQATGMAPLPMCELVQVISIEPGTSHWLEESFNEKIDKRKD